MTLPLFTIARSAFALYEINEATGVIGFDDFAAALGKIALKMALKAHSVDRGVLDDMVSLAQQRVPQDTGTLYAGIEGEEIDDYFEFRASARHVGASGGFSEDYAHFVELGAYLSDTPGASTSSAFARRRNKNTRRGNAGAEPEPFFYPAADEALQRRGLAMEDVIPDAASEDGWELA
jgi:hypothetical protein